VLVLTGTGRALRGYDLNSVATARQRQGTAERGSAFEVSSTGWKISACRRSAGSTAASMGLDRSGAGLRFPHRRRYAEMFMPAARLGLHYYKSGIERYVTRLVSTTQELF